LDLGVDVEIGAVANSVQLNPEDAFLSCESPEKSGPCDCQVVYLQTALGCPQTMTCDVWSNSPNEHSNSW
jgi:hypothetical protein